MVPLRTIMSLFDRSSWPVESIVSELTSVVAPDVPLAATVTLPATVRLFSRMTVVASEQPFSTDAWRLRYSARRRRKAPAWKSFVPPPVKKLKPVTGAKNSAVDPVETRNSPPETTLIAP